MRPLLLCLAAVTALLAQPLQAAPLVPSITPSVGSYFYFAALNPHCGASSRARTTALDRYKGQFLAMLGKMGAASPADLVKHRQYIADLERRQPNAAELAPFEPMFAKAKPGDVEQLCQNFEAGIAQRMKANESVDQPAPAQAQAKAPIRYYSLQHLHALMVSCEQVDPVAAKVAARAAAFARAIPRVRTATGLYRTEVGVDGAVKETDFASAALMLKSPEFEVDSKRYLAVVERRSKSALEGDCKDFVTLMDGVGKK
ncbi:MAG: hypothetical protein V4484_17905 [Pseudomonadota bacterium]